MIQQQQQHTNKSMDFDTKATQSHFQCIFIKTHNFQHVSWNTLKGTFVHQTSCTGGYHSPKSSVQKNFWLDLIGVQKITLLLKDPVDNFVSQDIFDSSKKLQDHILPRAGIVRRYEMLSHYRRDTLCVVLEVSYANSPRHGP